MFDQSGRQLDADKCDLGATVERRAMEMAGCGEGDGAREVKVGILKQNHFG